MFELYWENIFNLLMPSLVLLHVPKCFVPVEPVQKFNCIHGLFKNFCGGTKNKFAEWKSSFGVAQNVDQYLAWSKFFGILGLVEGRSINFSSVIRNLSLINYPDHRYWRRERSHKRGCLTQWHIQQVPFKRYYGQKQGWNYANSFSESSSKLQIDEWQQIPLQHHSFPERWRIFVRVSPFFSIW